MDIVPFAIAFGAAVAAGGINAIAGGGTLITYPTLNLLIGLPGKMANATNTMALWPASLVAAHGFKQAVPFSRSTVLAFCATSAFGALTGATLLKYTAEAQYEQIVPWLILMAAMLFLLQESILRNLSKNTNPTPKESPGDEPNMESRNGHSVAAALVFQFFVGVYGGYFGAGIGIIMLAALSFVKAGDIYQMSYLKNLGAMCINGLATILFGAWGMVEWRYAIVMASGAMLGGFLGTVFGKKIGPKALRLIISLIGCAIALKMLLSVRQH